MFDVFYMGDNPELASRIPFAKQVTADANINSQTKMYWLIEPNVEITDPDVLDYRPEDHDSVYEHIWKWNVNNYGGVRLLPKGESQGVKEVNQVVCKKSFAILNTSDPGDYFAEHPYADYVWCVDPDYKLDTDINWAPGNFEPEYIHSFHLRGQLEHRYPESEGGIKLYPRAWRTAHTKYHGFLDANVKYPVLFVSDLKDYSQRDIYTDDYVWLIDSEHSVNTDTIDWVPNPFEDGYIHCFRMPYQLTEKYPQQMGGIRLVPINWRDADIKIHPDCPVEDLNYDVFYTNKAFDSDTFEYYAKRSDTEWFWVVDRDYDFNGKLLYVPAEHESDYIHVFKWGLEHRYLPEVTELWDDRVAGIYLVHQDFDITKQKLHTSEVPVRYDVFYTEDVNNLEVYARKSKTDAFWLVDSEHVLSEVFTWVPSESEQPYINIFKLPGQLEHKYPRSVTNVSDNRCGGIKLVPKNYNVNDVKYQGLLTDIEIIEFQKFDSEEVGRENTKHDWFWVVDPDVDVVADFDWEYVPDTWDSGKTHVWQVANPVTGLNYDYAGVKLCHREPASGRPKYIKEIASTQKVYDVLYLDPEQDILEQLNSYSSSTKMYWVIDPWTELHPDFDFSVYPTQWDQDCVHVFKDDQDQYRNVRLVPKEYVFKNLSEISNNSFTKLKEHNVVASVRHAWPVVQLTSWDASELQNQTSEPWLFTIDPDVEVTGTDWQTFMPEITDYDRVHAWQKINPHTQKVSGYGGVRLWPTKEIHDVTSDQLRVNKIPRIRYVKEPLSVYKSYPVILLSYHEERAQTAFDALQTRPLDVHWVRDVEGIFEAHKEAAIQAGDATMFWVVDADAEVSDDFDFSYIPDVYDQDVVHVWASINPVTGSKYGYGGVKLFNTAQVNNSTSWGLDFTTGLSKRFKFMPEVSCTTMFNTSAYDTWRSAFREVVKLTVSSDPDAIHRIQEWLHPLPDAEFGDDARRGAEQAQAFAKQNINNITELDKINDYEWLQKKFQQG